MAKLLKGAPVAAAISEETAKMTEALRTSGITPVLAVVRVGEREDDLSYERGIVKRAAATGIGVRVEAMPRDVENGAFLKKLDELSSDTSVHGILMFRPLPKQIDAEAARRAISFEKDVDGCTDQSLCGVFTGEKTGFPPCTAEAAMEILKFYGTDPCGRRAVVIGRSLVIGRPAAMMLMHANATVTVCHTRTRDLPSVVREADIVVAATGKTCGLGADCFREGQIVIDVGIGWSEEKGKLCGDVDFDEVEKTVGAITPVPGGVGSVTTAILCRHAAEAAWRTVK